MDVRCEICVICIWMWELDHKEGWVQRNWCLKPRIGLPWWLRWSFFKKMPAVWENQVLPLDQEDRLEKEIKTHCSSVAWKIHGQRSLEGYSPWGHKEENTTEKSNCQHPLDHRKSKSSRRTSISALLTMPKPLTVWITINGGKFWKRWEYPSTWPASWETCMQVKKQQLELDMEQQTGSE